MHDLVHDAILEAVESFGGTDGTFNLAAFGKAIARMTGTTGSVDGRIAVVILTGRQDCEPLAGGAHYRLLG